MGDVLLFDPDPESRMKTARSYQACGRAVTECCDYDTAVDLARAERYSTVSFHMHDTEEMQLVTRLRELQPVARMYVAGDLNLISQHVNTLVISMNITPWVYHN